MTLTAEAKYPISFTQSGKRFVLSLHYNGSNRFLLVNATKIYQLRNKEGIKGVVNFFVVDFKPIDIKDILDIHKYLMKRM